MKSLLVIVAHPDDESIWFGGILKRLCDRYRLHILSVTHAGDVVRETEFARACGLLEAIPHMFDCRDGGNVKLPALGPKLDAFLTGKGLSHETVACVITHSPAGEEHSHPQHIQLHWQVAAWAGSRNMEFGFFASHPGISALSPLFSREISARSILYADSRKSLLRDGFNFSRALWFYRYLQPLKVAIDGDFKRNLLALYDAQSLRGYAAYYSPFEYLFTSDPTLIQILA